MTPSELLRIMARLGCTQAEAGELVGVSDRAMHMYVAGERKVPPAVAECRTACGELRPVFS